MTENTKLPRTPVYQLREYFLSLDAKKREAFAGKCHTTTKYLQQIYLGNDTCGEGLAIRIDKNSNGKVKVDDLRPDVDWDYVRNNPPKNIS